MPKRKRKTHSPQKTSIGTPNVAEAPGALGRFFRFAQLGVGQAGAERKIEDIFATFLKELEDSGVPAEAVERYRSLGPKTAFQYGGVPKSIATMAGKENVKVIKDTLKIARESVRGLQPGALTSAYQDFLKTLQEEIGGDPQGAQILKKMKGVDASKLAKMVASRGHSVLMDDDADELVSKIYQRSLAKAPVKKLPEGLIESVQAAPKQAAGVTMTAGKGSGILKTATEAAPAAAAEAGAQVGKLGKLGKFLPKSKLGMVGLVGGLAFDAHRAAGILGAEGRAKQKALAGFQQTGPASSVEFLRDQVRQQDAIERRKVVLQQYEPQLFEEVLRVLADQGQSPATLTPSERRIGSGAAVSAGVSRRSDEDVDFLLSELFRQMGN